MRTETLELLRCPFCGGRLHLVDTRFYERSGDAIVGGALGCACCLFPVVDGIPVMHARPEASAALAHLEARRPDLARRALIGFETDADAERFEAAARTAAASYQEFVRALGPRFEGVYFLYRFSDPSFVVVDAILRAVGGTVLRGDRRALDLCGGSGHLTRSLLDVTSVPPVLADLYFSKLWLAVRFTVPECEPVCCDGNGPLPFARGTFAYAMCADAFMFIWTKRRCVEEMARLIDGPCEPGAIAITHTHNQLVWSPSHGQTLTPAGYRDLFETLPARVFSEARLFTAVVTGGALDLSQPDPEAVLEADPALAIVASRDEAVFRAHPLSPPAVARGAFRINPLYAVVDQGATLRLTLTFPDEHYEDEFRDCLAYLPRETTLERAAIERLQAGGPIDELAHEIRTRVIIDLPAHYC